MDVRKFENFWKVFDFITFYQIKMWDTDPKKIECQN